MSKSILIVWAPDNCGLSDNELADHQAKLGAALEPATQKSSHPLFISPPPHPTRAADGGVHVSPR